MSYRRRIMGGLTAGNLDIGESLDFEYTGEVQSCRLFPGQYLLECWGAQGGGSIPYQQCGIEGAEGGLGGYSAGILDLQSPTDLYVFVGGEGKGYNGAGGFNGGGGTISHNFRESSSEFSCAAGGGGGTDISTVSSDMTYTGYIDDRSQESLLSRFIVAGGGAGGASSSKIRGTDKYLDSIKLVESISLTTSTNLNIDTNDIYSREHCSEYVRKLKNGTNDLFDEQVLFLKNLNHAAGVHDLYIVYTFWYYRATGSNEKITLDVIRVMEESYSASATIMFNWDAGALERGYVTIDFYYNGDSNPNISADLYATKEDYVSIGVNFNYYDYSGYNGGGTYGGSVRESDRASQTEAGTNGSFGKGGYLHSGTNTFYCGGGGGGWYGGQGAKMTGTYNNIERSGGGSGFVNIAENAQYRPTGYTGLELSYGTTLGAGSSNEYFTDPHTGDIVSGHSGNGYARITRSNIMIFDYTGDVQTVTLRPGKYRLQCWGAAGGTFRGTIVTGGRSTGGYSTGELTLGSTTTLYVYVGGAGSIGTSGEIHEGGFNGGGASSTGELAAASGGGASDIRIGSDSLYARVIVAGGGGGEGEYSASRICGGGDGGGETGGSGGFGGGSESTGGTGGTQTSAPGNAGFGFGASATSGKYSGGGGGWYGGSTGYKGGAGGGSGYIYTSETASNYPEGCLLNENYYLENASTISGSVHSGIPDPAKLFGNSVTTGNSGNGCIRITQILE